MQMLSVASVLFLISIAGTAVAKCAHQLPVSGAVSLSSCDPKTAACLEPEVAWNRFQKKFGELEEKNRQRLTLKLFTSPWRAYDSSSRIMSIDELARPSREGIASNPSVKRVEIIGSWSGVRPSPEQASLAEQLSRELDGFPVSGGQGFIWFDAKGGVRTTRQAFTILAGRHMVAADGEVMLDLPLSNVIPAAGEIRAGKDGKGLLLLGVAWDVFGLCPEQALLAFEDAAALGEPTAAYNAAVMRRQPGALQDLSKSATLMKRSAELGFTLARTELGRATTVPSGKHSAQNRQQDTGLEPPATRRRPSAKLDARECLRNEDFAKLRACAERFR